ncbi:MAG TPA: lytic transglycosylase domain-containing protein [Nitrospirae bacterium]|nr:lytic transglycosylase domain-containing protein [Nitrospirota bacterium]
MKAGRGEQTGDCPEKESSGYTVLSKNRGYYGFLSRSRVPESGRADKLEITIPAVPNGTVYERIEMLKSLGMNREAAEEIKSVLTSVRGKQVFKYLAFTAIEVGEYNRIIYFTEDIEDEEFLPLSFPRGYRDIVEDASRRDNVDAFLILALIREESRFDPEAFSIAGATGLMQLMPATAHRMRQALNMDAGDNIDIYSVKANISLGTHYLSLLIKEFEEIPLAIAAYNAGERAVRRWLKNSKHRDIEEFIEDIPYRETRRYVKKVLRSYWQYRAIEGLPMKEGGI